MKRENRIKSILLSLILALLLPVMATASGSNTLTIYKVVNASGTHLLHEKPSGASTPIPGAIYRIWRVGEVDRSTDQAGYDAWLAQLKALSISELDEAYPEPVEKRSFPTDTNGKTVFSNLPDGRYYVREVEEIAGALASVNTSVPFLVDLPYLLDGELLSEISVHPKGTKPDVPDEPDEPEKPPEGGEKFIKVDDKGVGLEGARFKLMLRVKNEEGKAKVDASGAYIYEPVLRDGKEIILVSGKDGRFEITGLDYGVYWLVETTAPEGYQLLKEPLEFVVSQSSYGDAVIFRIINKPKEPDKPDKPDEPDKPVKPDEPDKPVKPDEPVKPKPPVTPTKPTTPSKVVIPETGDVEFYLFMASGFALILLGAWITRDAELK